MENIAEHKFIFNAKWTGGRNDIGEIQSGNLTTKVSIPSSMDGPGIGTNPDELLLSAASTCYLISLATMLEYSKIQATLSLHSEGIVQVSKAVLTYKKIIHNIEISLLTTSERAERITKRLAVKAEETCMISKALKGNVEIIINCTII